MEFWIHVANIAAIYVVLTLSLNLKVGYAGLFTVTQGALYGIGAYGLAIASVDLGMPFVAAVLVAMLAPALVGILLAMPSLRLSGDYLVIASLGLQTVIVVAMMSLDFTGGPGGIPGIPRPSIAGYRASDSASYLPLTLGAAALVTAWMLALAHSPFGRVLKMIREDELAAAAVGKNVVAFKVSAFVLGSAMAGLAGALYASYVTFIDPTSFSVTESIYILTLVVIGGSGTVLGSVAGAVSMVTLGEAIRFLPMPSSAVGEARQALYGSLLIGFMLWRPQGLLGESWRRIRSRGTEAWVGVSPTPGIPTAIPVLTERADRHPGKLPYLECDSLVAGYDNLTVLRGVSVIAHEAEIVVIVGHNGAGKSTLLRVIAGLTPATQGRVLLRGEEVTNRQQTLRGDRRIALVPQTGGVFPEMTVAENLQLAGYLLRDRPRELRDRVDFVLDLFPQFRDMLDRRARQLSGGQQRMLSLAASLVPGHGSLLLDEPSIGLSPALVESTLATIQRITRQLHMTTVLCEQNVRAALRVADRTYVLKAGRVAAEAQAGSELLRARDLWKLF